MVNWIITSSILITAVIGIRAFLGKKISMRLRYGLWLLVLVRLLIPGNFIPSNFSVENITGSLQEQPQMQQLSQEWNTPQESYEEVYQEVLQQHYQEYYQPDGKTENQTINQSQTAETATVPVTLPPLEQEQIRQETELRVEQSAPIYSLRQILIGVWILGGAAVGTFLIAVNWDFSRRLKRTRHPVPAAGTPVPVYQSFMAETPCLFGLFRPVIYITEETVADSVSLSHILAHESSHYYHKDHIWAVLRCVCLILHWYNPLVWVAIALSRRDCELACDEATLTQIGENSRIEYGRTLVEMTCVKRAPAAMLLTATTMLSDKKTLTQRIRQVAKRPKVLLSAIVAVVVVAAIAVGCTFTGAPEKPTDPTEPSGSTAPPEITAPTETTKPTDPAGSTIPENAYPAGKYLIGTDIPADTYVFIPESSEIPGSFRVEDVRQTVTETFTEFFIWSPSSGVTVDAANCYFLPADDFTVPVNEDGSYGPGMYRIGTDIPDGSYVITPLSRDTPAVWKLFFSINLPRYHNDSYSKSATVSSSIRLGGAANRYEAIFLQDCTLTPVVSETFTIPEAPTAAAVQPRPPYDGALVTPYWEQGVDIIGHSTYFISIPQIWPFSQDAIDCQAEIYEDLLPTLKYYEETAGYTDLYDVRLLPISEKTSYQKPRGISYSNYIYKDILSIVVGTLRVDDMTQYFAYNLDLTTGKRMNNEDILKRLNLGSVDIKEALSSAYTQLYGSSSGPQLEKTISKDNINATQFYVTGDGSVMAAARIYSIAGADSYMHLIPVYTPPVLSGRAAIRTRNADWNYQPSSTPEATAQNIVEHFQGAGQILLAETDYFMTQANITEEFINSDIGRKYELTAEYLQDHFACVNVLYQQDQTAIYVAKITLMQDEENGLWYLWDMLTPYGTGAYPENDSRLATYTALFDSTTGNGRMRQMALTSFYEQPEEANIPLLLSTDFSYGALTKAEETFLKGKGVELGMDVRSHSAAEIDVILWTVFGKSFGADLSSLLYFPEADTYYGTSAGSAFPNIVITRYQDMGGGIVKIYYTCQTHIHYGYENREFFLTLREGNGTWQIMSNSLPE